MLPPATPGENDATRRDTLFAIRRPGEPDHANATVYRPCSARPVRTKGGGGLTPTRTDRQEQSEIADSLDTSREPAAPAAFARPPPAVMLD